MKGLKQLAVAEKNALFAIDNSGSHEALFSAVGCCSDAVPELAAAASLLKSDMLQARLTAERAAHSPAFFELIAEQGRDAWMDGCMLGLHFDVPIEGEEIDAEAFVAAKAALRRSPRRPGEGPTAAVLRAVGLEPEPVESDSLRRATEHALLYFGRIAEEEIPDCIQSFSELWLDGLTVAIQARREHQPGVR